VGGFFLKRWWGLRCVRGVLRSCLGTKKAAGLGFGVIKRITGAPMTLMNKKKSKGNTTVMGRKKGG